MRNDVFGFFWDDIPPEKVKKEKEKRTPPERHWERPDYLPGLLAAYQFAPNLFTPQTLWEEAIAGNELTYDVECYPNYFLVAFKSLTTGRVLMIESYCDSGLDLNLLRWVMETFKIVSFNGIWYDEPIINVAMTGASCATLSQITYEIIVLQTPSWQILRRLKIKKTDRLKLNHVDLIEVCPLQGGLKAYSGRLHCKKMQDLPFVPGTNLSPQQAMIVRLYCVNDLDNTALLRNELREELDLRDHLSKEYDVDVRSKSDAQIAEALFKSELEALGNSTLHPSPVVEGRIHRYRDPGFLRFESEYLNQVFQTVLDTEFVERDSGGVDLPESLKNLKVKLGDNAFQMGIGGLHSTEKRVSHYSSATHQLFDFDVASYYPKLILNVGMYPMNIGIQFLIVYKTFVDRRLAAKAAKRTAEANSLKIVVNGAFGKLGDRFSIMYNPAQLLQTTLTGQLSLLMLIEVLVNRGIGVVSANTDGIVIKCPREHTDLMHQIIKWWEGVCNLEMEFSPYKSFHSRDVNAYIAVKEDGTIKGIGPYKNPWADPKLKIFRFHKNPKNTVCVEAVTELLRNGTNPYEYIRNCKDITKFVSTRKVKDGAVRVHKDGNEYLGEHVRFYYGTNVEHEMVYAKNGNTVPESQGAQPCLVLPDQFPEDVDYSAYDARVDKILKEIAYELV